MINILKILKNKLYTAHSLFLIISVIFGLFFAIIIPPFMGLDEGAHFSRAYQIANGGIVSWQHNNTVGGSVPKSVLELSEHAYSIRNGKDTQLKRDLTKLAYSEQIGDEEVFSSFVGAAAYTPIPYLPAVLGYWVGDLLNMSVGATLLLSRLLMLVLFVVIVYWSIKILNNYKIKWLIVAIALLPLVIFQAATVNADSLAIALSLLMFAIFYKSILEKSLSKSEIILLSVVSILIPLVKFNYIFISFIIFLVPSVSFKTWSYISKNNLYYKIFSTILAVVLTTIWLSLVVKFGDGIKGEAGGVAAQVKFLIDNPLNAITIIITTFFANGSHYPADYIFSMVGRMGFNSVNVPVYVVVSSWMLVIVAGFYARIELLRNIKLSLTTSVLSIVSGLSVLYTLYLTFSATGADQVGGMHGRYFLPILPFIVTMMAIMIPLSVKAKNHDILNTIAVLSTINFIVSLLYYIYFTYGF